MGDREPAYDKPDNSGGEMNTAMNGFFSQTIALGVLALVAVFPSPEHFKDALKLPIRETSYPTSSFTPEMILSAAYQTGSPDLSLFGSTSFMDVPEVCTELDPTSQGYLTECGGPLYRYLSLWRDYHETYTYPERAPGSPISGEEAAALLGEACRQEWAISPDPDSVVYTPPCDVLFVGLAQNESIP